MPTPRYHVIYINIVGKGSYAYSISIENDYQLVIELWCRYAGKMSYKRVLREALREAMEEYVRMGLGETPVVVAIPDNKSSREVVGEGFLEVLAGDRVTHEVIYVAPKRYRRGVELAKYCLKRGLDRYPPRKNL